MHDLINFAVDVYKRLTHPKQKSDKNAGPSKIAKKSVPVQHREAYFVTLVPK